MSFAQVRIDGDICLEIICDRDRQDIVLAEAEDEVEPIDKLSFGRVLDKDLWTSVSMLALR